MDDVLVGKRFVIKSFRYSPGHNHKTFLFPTDTSFILIIHTLCSVSTLRFSNRTSIFGYARPRQQRPGDYVTMQRDSGAWASSWSVPRRAANLRVPGAQRSVPGALGLLRVWASGAAADLGVGAGLPSPCRAGGGRTNECFHLEFLITS